jgi:hypothetical protein
MQLFHYHPVRLEAGFNLVARHGRIEEDTTSFEAGTGWDELDRIGFKLRLTELERGAVNIVVQPGQWELPRLDHLGISTSTTRFQPCRVVPRTGARHRYESVTPFEKPPHSAGITGARHRYESVTRE